MITDHYDCSSTGGSIFSKKNEYNTVQRRLLNYLKVQKHMLMQDDQNFTREVYASSPFRPNNLKFMETMSKPVITENSDKSSEEESNSNGRKKKEFGNKRKEEQMGDVAYKRLLHYRTIEKQMMENCRRDDGYGYPVNTLCKGGDMENNFKRKRQRRNCLNHRGNFNYKAMKEQPIDVSELKVSDYDSGDDNEDSLSKKFAMEKNSHKEKGNGYQSIII